MLVRKFEQQDLPQVLDLCRQVRNYHIEILHGYFAPQDDNFEKYGFLESLKNDDFIALVIEENKEILGYLLAEYKYSPHLLEAKVVHIANIGIKQELRGQGLGKKLMSSFYNICQQNNVDEIRLGVFNKNVSAYKFYEQYGFEPFEQRMKLRLKK